MKFPASSFAPLLPTIALLTAPLSMAGEAGDQVEAELAAGRYGKAIALCEENVRSAPRDADAWFLLGRVLLRSSSSPSGAAGNPALLVGDAAAAFSKGMELDPRREEDLPFAYDAYMASGEIAAAAAIAARGLGASTLAQGLPTGLWLERTARAERLLFNMEAPEDPEEYADALQALEARFLNARAVRPEHAPVYLEHARLLIGVGLQHRAAQVLSQGLEKAPADIGLHRQLIDLYVRADVADRLPAIYADLSAQAPEEGLVWWYRSWVNIVVGERNRQEVLFHRAEDRLAESMRCAKMAAELTPEHAKGARQLQHRALLGMAFCSLAEKNHDLALERLMQLMTDSPELRDERDGLGRSVIDGIGILGARYTEVSDYGAGASLMRFMSELLPEDASWWNNLAYMLRQHAMYVEAKDGAVTARAIFQESWDAYQRAVALHPTSVRYTNDAALIQVYHLRDDLPLAEEMLLEAVAIGESQIEALGPDPDETDRYPLALATGDALENLGYLFYHVQPDPEKALAYYERAVATESGLRWTVQAHLEALRGERDPVQEHNLLGQAPTATLPRPHIAWEISFNGALERSEHEQRPLFLYYRGEGLQDIDGEVWFRLLSREGMSESLTPTVPVVADFGRHTSTDRRADGTQIACPRYGAISCSAHIRAAEEFGRFFAERADGVLPGADEEGYHLFAAGGESLEWNEAFFAQLYDKTVELTEAIGLEMGTPLPGPDARQLQVDLRAAARAGNTAVIQGFAASKTALERAALEALLFDTTASRVERREVLNTLARSSSTNASALLAACLHQSRDAELQALAAASWPNEDDVMPLMRAAQWGRTQAAQQAASENLRSLRPEAPNQRYLAISTR